MSELVLFLSALIPAPIAAVVIIVIAAAILVVTNGKSKGE